MPPPPLLGYNNNVRHRGRIFHIQTEDSGIASPRIMTHLFADGGRIVKSTRTDYSEHLELDDMAAVVKNMMKEQHKAMFVALRSGKLDEIIGFDPEEPPASTAGSTAVLEKAADLVEAEQAKKADNAKEKKKNDAPSAPRIEVKEVTIGGDASYAASRPAAIFSVPPPSSSSIFGEVGIDEKSLDDAILSYLAEDPEEENDGEA